MKKSLFFLLLLLLLSLSLVLVSCDNTDSGKTDDNTTDDGSTDGGSTDDGSTDDGGSDDGTAGGGETDDGGSDDNTAGGDETGGGSTDDTQTKSPCDAPVLMWDSYSAVLSWDAVEGADSYVLTLGGTEIPLTECRYKMPSGLNGKFFPTVRAIGDATHADSAESAPKEIWVGWITVH